MWNKISDGTMPVEGQKCWYHAPQVGTHRGHSDGYYISEKNVVYRGMHIFVHESGNFYLTGDVTHWHDDQEEEPIDVDN